MYGTSRKKVIETVRALAHNRVLLDPDDAELMLAVREQVQAEHGFWPQLDSELQAEIIDIYDRITNAD